MSYRSEQRLDVEYPNEPERPILRVELADTLEPGGDCQARAVHRTPGGEYDASARVLLAIYDPDNCNYGLAGERFRVRLHADSGRYECVGSQGLRRKGVITESGGITYDMSGEVSIFADGADTGENVEAWLNWMHNDTNSAEGDKVIVQWFRDEDDGNGQWVFIGRECTSDSASPCDSCTGSVPAAFNVAAEYANLTGDCTCANFDGTYRCERLGSVSGVYQYSCTVAAANMTGRCVWLSDWETASAGGSCDVDRYRLGVHIFQHTGTADYYLAAFTEFEMDDASIEYCIREKGYGATAPACDTFSDEAIGSGKCHSFGDCAFTGLSGDVLVSAV